ncbi:MAG TPA: hypothetical protein VJ785_18245 [Anaerolineales bacterium]|nr:hypothetical protein [Anaerolineales bacterium]
MNVSPSSVLVAGELAGRSFTQKMMVASLIVAIVLALLPIQGAFAAPDPANNYEQEWKNKLEKVRVNGIFYERVRVYPADFEDQTELALAHGYLNQYGAALRGAQTVILNHTGFDTKGKVLNDTQANQSLKQLSEYLRIMRVMNAKLNALEGEYRLLPAGTTTVTSSQ